MQFKKALETTEVHEIEKNIMLCRQTYYNSPKALKTLAITLKKQREKTVIATIMDKNSTCKRGKSKIASCFRD